MRNVLVEDNRNGIQIFHRLRKTGMRTSANCEVLFWDGSFSSDPTALRSGISERQTNRRGIIAANRLESRVLFFPLDQILLARERFTFISLLLQLTDTQWFRKARPSSRAGLCLPTLGHLRKKSTI